MPVCPILHNYVKAQADGKQDDPKAHYLLGFERDKVESLPVKTYIRRLWLAFQSSEKSSLPRYFFDAEAERFAKEVEAWVSDLVKDEDRLAVEVAKDSIVLNEKTKETRSAFLEDIARTMLVTRGWGDHLWGHRRFCTSPVANAKRELGDDKPPQWPEDHELIVVTVRHWLAARLQDKLQNPRQAKFVPRVECPQNAAQEREAILAVFQDTTLYDSEEEGTDLVTQGPVDATEKVTQSQNPEEDTLPRKSSRQRKPSARAIDSERLQLSCTGSTSQAGQREYLYEEATEAPSSARPNPPVAPPRFLNQHSDTHKLDTAVPWVAPVAPSPLKRKRRVKYVKPSRTALKTRKKPTRPLPTPAPSMVVSQVPSCCLHGSSNSAPMQDLGELHTGHNPSIGSCELPRPTENIVSQDHSLPDSGSRMSGMDQRRAGIFVPPQKHSGHPIDTAMDVRDQDDKGGWRTCCSHCRGAAPSPLRCAEATIRSRKRATLPQFKTRNHGIYWD